MNKSRFAIAAVLLALPLSACGGDDESTDSTTTTSAAVSKATTTTSGSASASATKVDVALKDFEFMPGPVNVKAGEVVFHAHNDGQAPHNYKIRQNGKVIFATKDLDPGQSEDLKATLEPGVYNVYCDEGGHEALGMKATLTVS